MTTKGNQSQRITKDSVPAERARIKAGFTLKKAAIRMRISEKYLRQLERSGRAPLKTARRLSRLYKCSAEIFIHTPHYLEQLGQRTTQVSNASLSAGANEGSNSFASRRPSSSKMVSLKLVKGIKGDILPSSTRRSNRTPTTHCLAYKERPFDRFASTKKQKQKGKCRNALVATPA